MNDMLGPERMVQISGMAYLLFAMVGTGDGIYYHWHKYRLHLRAESRLEHDIHTLRAFLFIPITYLMFVQNSAGLWLWSAVGFILLDLAAEGLDLLVEEESRRSLGGLSSGEAFVHVAATSLRFIALTLMLVSKPMSAWSISAYQTLPVAHPAWLVSFATIFWISCLIGGVCSLRGLNLSACLEKCRPAL